MKHTILGYSPEEVHQSDGALGSTQDTPTRSLKVDH
jgi:hypothetical protein